MDVWELYHDNVDRRMAGPRPTVGYEHAVERNLAAQSLNPKLLNLNPQTLNLEASKNNECADHVKTCHCFCSRGGQLSIEILASRGSGPMRYSQRQNYFPGPCSHEIHMCFEHG